MEAAQVVMGTLALLPAGWSEICEAPLGLEIGVLSGNSLVDMDLWDGHKFQVHRQHQKRQTELNVCAPNW